ncbi:hypothetical protein OBBRIDRAFT_834473 [Obba rivulosa]|uniref:RING-type domain-containing protein n=1 Tax=Obba rivulosa TaxID=1052685 RepID=A0A8E2DNS0_9APHY|nr:hypothetical protein OBBRIDRAFT_834473 [Obba rivulosa]
MGQSVSRRSPAPPQTPLSQPADSERAARGNADEASSSSRPSPDKRSRRASRTLAPPGPSASGSSVNTDNSNGDTIVASSTPSSASSKRSKRSSLRRSILRYLPRSHSSSNSLHEPYSETEGTEQRKKRWRSSRRWSKAPMRTSNLRESTSGDTLRAGNEERVGDAVSGESSSGTQLHSRTPITHPSSTPLVDPNSQPPSEPEHNLTERASDRPNGPSSTPPTSEPLSSGAPRSQTSDEIRRDISDFLGNGPSLTATTTTPAAESGATARGIRPSITSAAPSANPGPTAEQGHDFAQQVPRQFPPPGTLVVVQGVVNTTDAPTTAQSPPGRGTSSAPSSAPEDSSLRQSASTLHSSYPEDRNGGRNRLSSLIPRPSSVLMRRLSSDTATTPETSNGDSTSASDFLSSATSEHTTQDNSSTGQHPSDSNAANNAENDGRPRPLSPGSIDVLGTLLSVAAAATAASLFSPNMVFGTANSSNSGSANSRPMSPTPTSGLNNLASLGGPLSGLAGFGVGPSPSPANVEPAPGIPGSGSAAGVQNPREARDRIRNVWDTLRDRLGRHTRDGPPTATSGAAPTATTTTSGESAPSTGAGVDTGASTGAGASTSAENEARMRPGEFMLAEMARALNTGLGLNGDATHPDLSSRRSESSGTTDAATAWPSVDDANRPMPAEDSFERFLINLQADLRVALTEGDAPSSGPEQTRSESATAPVPSSTAERASTESPVVPLTNADVTDIIHPSSEEASSPAENDDDDDDEPPPLQDVSDSSDDELDSEVYVPEASDVHPSPRIPTPIPTSGAAPLASEERGNIADRRSDRRPPGINLWRIYRFPPIHADQAQAHAAHTSPSNHTETASGLASTAAPLSSEGTQTASAATSSAATPAEQRRPTTQATTPAAHGDANSNSGVVVPVIVVGLQSVDMAHAHDHDHADHEAFFPSEEVPAGEGVGETPEDRESATATPTPMDGPTGQRGRNWHSRAANALRTLRPSRRGASQGGATTEGSGSRTFLIYVIGGYYPPNHHMVMGSDSLDSYEALWELAELLGQVKPPVATREDIDNSGLQIFKSTDLQAFEKEGKVASNCVDRCLICLDDYDTDDELRLMSCKHAFHKDCVDKWLQVGRNNCPACRSKGVSTVTDAQSS